MPVFWEVGEVESLGRTVSAAVAVEAVATDRVPPTFRTLVSAEQGEMARSCSDLPHHPNRIQPVRISISIRPGICVQVSPTRSDRFPLLALQCDSLLRSSLYR